MKNNKSIGKVTEDERDEIQRLYERKNGLTELIQSLVKLEKNEIESCYIYEKLVVDMGKTATEFNKWWEVKSKKYNWKNKTGFKWQIQFDTCDIYLMRTKG